MKLTAEESRALGFIALLIGLSIGARLVNRPEPVAMDAASVDVSALEAASREALGERSAPVRALAEGERIDPNTAPLEALRRLPRMTRALAERMVEDRRRNGRYGTLADLDRIQGVGPATLEAWAPHLTLPPPSAGNSAAGGGTARAPPAGSGAPRELELNRASARELERLPGIGPALAERIVAKRDSLGGFRSVDELETVRGIGPALMTKLRPLLRLGN